MSAEAASSKEAEEEDEEEDLEKLQAEIARMEEEAARITRETDELERSKKASSSTAGGVTTSTDGTGDTSGEGTGDGSTPLDAKAQALRDAKSVYVGQVDYSTTPVELLSHFEACGTVERVTIVCDKYTGRPKGYAYLEFQTEQAVENAVKLDGSEFKGRHLKVTHKRVNQPAFMLYQQQFQTPGAVGTVVPGSATTAAGGATIDVSGRGGRGAFRGGRAPGGFRGGGFRGGGSAYRGGYRGGGRGGYRGGFGRASGYHPYY